MLLKAASELVGGDKVLARRLGIADTLLAKFMTDVVQLPDALLLRTVDIVLEHRRPDSGPTASAQGALGLQGGD
jgi:DNA-binding transcriptional regulator YdaS (Cro superfamily)